MSWSFAKAGKDLPALKQAVQAETGCPQAVRDEICRRFDEGANWMTKAIEQGSCVIVRSHGHLDSEDRPYRNFGEMRIAVETAPFIDTPAATSSGSA